MKAWPQLLCLLLVPALAAGCGSAPRSHADAARADGGGRQVRPVGGADRLIVLREHALGMMEPDRSGGGQVERPLVASSALPLEGASLSVPVAVPADRVLVCAAPHSDSGSQQITAYEWSAGHGLSVQLTFRTQGVWDEGPGTPAYARAYSWIPSQAEILFATPAGENLADWRVVQRHGTRISQARAETLPDLRHLGALLDDMRAMAYSADGRTAVLGSYRRLGLVDLATGRVQTIPTAVDYYWSVSLTSEPGVVAYIGEVDGRPEDTEHPELDYIPNVNAFGVTWTQTRRAAVWRIGEVRGLPKGATFPEQSAARIAGPTGNHALYFVCQLPGEDGLALVRFDTARSLATVVAHDVLSFALVAMDSAPRTGHQTALASGDVKHYHPAAPPRPRPKEDGR
jgi:hypothetical protein